jgi:hypothetical protein
MIVTSSWDEGRSDMEAVRKNPHPLIVRTVAVWLVIIAAEIIHGYFVFASR